MRTLVGGFIIAVGAVWVLSWLFYWLFQKFDIAALRNGFRPRVSAADDAKQLEVSRAESRRLVAILGRGIPVAVAVIVAGIVIAAI